MIQLFIIFLLYCISDKTVPQKCNSDEIKTGYSLKGGTRAGHVNDLGGTASIHDCVKRCCNKKVCDVALLLDGRCFGVSCFSKELCEPIPVPHPHYVSSQIAFLNQAERRAEVERTRPGMYVCIWGRMYKAWKCYINRINSFTANKFYKNYIQWITFSLLVLDRRQEQRMFAVWKTKLFSPGVSCT